MGAYQRSDMHAIRYYPRLRFAGRGKTPDGVRVRPRLEAVDVEAGTLKQGIFAFVWIYQVLKEQESVIYEIRTYNLKLGQLNEYWERFGEKLPGRQKLSKLGGHWYTEVGPLNQMVAIWPYESLEQRAEIRRAAEAGPNPIWPPDTSDLIVSMVSEIYLPAPFMTPLGDRDIGPIYEMRLYTYPSEGMPQVLEAWGASIPERVKYSPLAGCWYSEYGGINNFIHIWAYRSFEERQRIRAETREKGVWPPKGSVRPITQESKLLLPAPFSPMQ